MSNYKTSYSSRKYTLNAIFIIAGLTFIVRLFFIQIYDTKYKLSANSNTLRYLTEFPARGLIYDRNGKLLVYNEATYDLMVIPRYVQKMDTIELCKLIEIDIGTFRKKLEAARAYSIYTPSIFEKQLSKATYGYLQEKMYKYPGFYVQARTLRKYPIPMAAHTLGYIGEVSPEYIKKDNYYKPGDYIGISGIEKSYEKELRGTKGLKIIMVDVHNREKGSFQNGMYDTIAVAGSDLYASLDADLQLYAQKLLTNKKGSIVAIEPSTGEILALVSSPTYDPNLLVGRTRSDNYIKLMQDELKPLFDRALMALYPPGSTFKIINALIGLQDKVLTPETKFTCEHGFHFGNQVVECHSHASPLNLPQSIQHSCNAYYCKAFRSIVDKKSYPSFFDGYKAWREHVLSFNIGKKFNNDLPNELNGNVPTLEYYDRYYGKKRWNSYSVISLSIGQGELGITPLQLANLSAIVANRGYYYTPHIVKAIEDKNKPNPRFIEKHRTYTDSIYFTSVVEGMYQVVEAGTARNAKMDSITICGKTGTAQNPHGKNHSLFIAFAPKDKPKIAIAVVIENAGFGATWAAPIASLMIERYITGKDKRTDVEASMINANLMSAK